MKFILVEPYDGGSHHYFNGTLMAYLKESFAGAVVDLVSLPARHWRLRFLTAHLSLAQMCNELKGHDEKSIIITNSLMDVSAFKSQLRGKLRDCKIVTYFHENQMSYPLNPQSPGAAFSRNYRDHFYPLVHLNQILASDVTVFNSVFCKSDTFSKVQSWLSSRQEKIEVGPLKKKEEDAYVIPITGFKGEGIRLEFKERPKKIIWNHRWEFDKNPRDFFKVLRALFTKKSDLQAAIMGEARGQYDNVFDQFLKDFKDQVVAFGHQKRDDYWQHLKEGRLLFVTSHHDFLGLSVLEAIHCGVVPLLPRRMVYPELIPDTLQHKLIYSDQESTDDLVKRSLELIEEGLSEEEWRTLWDYHQRFESEAIGKAWHDLIKKV